MQEEAVSMNDDEISDSEVIMFDSNQRFAKTTQEQQAAERQLKSQVRILDTQLKALGLYEEGLSYEQKEELLAVVAASRETAQHEESMRLQAQEWQQEVYPDEVKFGGNSNSQMEMSPSSIKSCTPPKVESTLQLLDHDEVQSVNCDSQDLFDMEDCEVITANDSPELSPGDRNCITQALCDEAQQERHYISYCGQDSYLISSEGFLTMDDFPPLSGVNVRREVDTVSQGNYLIQKKEMDKVISRWQPCLSPEVALDTDRYSTGAGTLRDSPSENEFCQEFIRNVETFHHAVNGFQKNSGIYIAWGNPITVGRAYATRSTRSKVNDSENTDGIYSFHQANGDHSPVSDNSLCESYLRLRQFSKSSGHSSTMPNSATLMSVTRTPHNRSDSFSQSTLRLSNVGALKRSRTSSKKSESMNDVHKISSLANPMLGGGRENSENNPSFINTLTMKKNCSSDVVTNQRNTLLFKAEVYPCRDSENQEEGSKSDISRPRPMLSLSESRRRRILRAAKMSEKMDTIESISCSKLVADTEADISWEQETNADVVEQDSSKRRKCRARLSSFSSPSKRLKETGTL